jgi:hypothetical protein
MSGRLCLPVHAILGVRASPSILGSWAESQDRMDRIGKMIDRVEEKVNVWLAAVGQSDPPLLYTNAPNTIPIRMAPPIPKAI